MAHIEWSARGQCAKQNSNNWLSRAKDIYFASHAGLIDIGGKCLNCALVNRSIKQQLIFWLPLLNNEPARDGITIQRSETEVQISPTVSINSKIKHKVSIDFLVPNDFLADSLFGLWNPKVQYRVDKGSTEVFYSSKI